jgi:ketosteroid isomerase-like protein
MKIIFAGLAFLIVATANGAIPIEKEKLKADLVRTEKEFFEHAATHGFNAGLHAYMADDAFIANSLVLGRDAQSARIKGEQGKATTRANVIHWKPLRADVSNSGDLGYTWGVAEAGPTKEGPFKPYGIYATIWKRQPDGKWRFVFDSATILTAEAVEKFLRDNYPGVGSTAPLATASAKK